MISLIPISDANPTRRFPVVTIGLIVANVVAFFREPGFGDSVGATVYFVKNAPLPCQFQDACPAAVSFFQNGVPITIPERGLGSFVAVIIVSIFLHAGWLHIAGNMLFLWVFGNNIEDYLGPVKYLLFYLLGGIAASMAHVLTHLDSVLPTVGASGAIAAVMGAYLVLYPRAKVNVLVPIFIIFTIVQLSAFVVLGLWFLYQFLIGAQEATGASAVAWMAHVGGFAFGILGILLLGGRPQPRRVQWDPYGRYGR
jgi:rhomboid family protein